MIMLYGIKTCDTVRKACRWLDAAGIAYQYYDLRKDGLTQEVLAGWLQQVGWEKLLNRSGMTYRKLSAEDKERLNADTALGMLLEQPTLMRRPILLEDGKVLHLGFKPEQYEALFLHK
ncbi:ArsC family reductase [Neokomagataea anthophila]|uniref:ArsC family reductase n=1 Tax=Neokomagataea anthophila TaxID=2826925 RepID=A0ABS5E887_9PROT|nr:ArsC family reductase [Neokomagataea anthophila]MBR0560127.1 ArsC family reductase [Neokomagataea anthophila]